METTQIPEVREPQRDHILCFHFSAPSIWSCVLCRVPRCTNHPEWLGCVRMFPLAWCLLHRYKWLHYFLIKPHDHPTWLSWNHVCSRAGGGRPANVLPLRMARRLRSAGAGPPTLPLGATSCKRGCGSPILNRKCCIRAPAFASSPTTDRAAPSQQPLPASSTDVLIQTHMWACPSAQSSVWLPDNAYRLPGHAHQQGLESGLSVHSFLERYHMCKDLFKIDQKSSIYRIDVKCQQF